MHGLLKRWDRVLAPQLRAEFEEADFYDFVKAARHCLAYIPVHDWAVAFLELRTLFWHRFAGGRIFSTAHGADFFDNVWRGVHDPMPWEEKGELGRNFNLMLDDYRRLPCQEPNCGQELYRHGEEVCRRCGQRYYTGDT